MGAVLIFPNESCANCTFHKVIRTIGFLTRLRLIVGPIGRSKAQPFEDITGKLLVNCVCFIPTTLGVWYGQILLVVALLPIYSYLNTLNDCLSKIGNYLNGRQGTWSIHTFPS